MKITPHTHEFLSNFYGHAIWFEGQQYPTAENAFQASRFVSTDMRRRFAYMATHYANYCGRTYRTTVPDWREKRYDILYEILQIKFSDQELAEALKATGDAEIVMTNKRHDNEYGVCICYKCRHSSRVGQNQLGLLLMKLRDELQGKG